MRLPVQLWDLSSAMIMKIHNSASWLLLNSVTIVPIAVVFLTACGPGRDAVFVTANDRMEFEPSEFVVSAGERVTLVFQNIGDLPIDVMGHNLVILGIDTDPLAFALDSQRHPQDDYIDPGRKGEVIAATKVLGPGNEVRLRFTAPDLPGEYPFVSTVPGHADSGMNGIMIVR